MNRVPIKGSNLINGRGSDLGVYVFTSWKILKFFLCLSEAWELLKLQVSDLVTLRFELRFTQYTPQYVVIPELSDKLGGFNPYKFR